MQKLKLVGGLLGLSGVALGAFGAHALKSTLAANGMASAWEIAVLYQLVHSVAIYATVVSANPAPKAAWSWACGILLFSGSLFALALGGPSWLGPITPIGGAAFLLGWVFALIPSGTPSSSD